MLVKNVLREWLSGGALPCQGRGRGFESRLALFLFLGYGVSVHTLLFFVPGYVPGAVGQVRIVKIGGDFIHDRFRA